MKLDKDKKSLFVNDSLTLEGILPEVFDCRLGNRSALDWVIDQYQAYTDKRSGINSDPNREVDPEYIVRLIGQVVRVSVETVKIVSSLPKSYGGPPKPTSPPIPILQPRLGASVSLWFSCNSRPANDFRAFRLSDVSTF
jgi:Type ISP C-terminal specificity domain